MKGYDNSSNNYHGNGSNINYDISYVIHYQHFTSSRSSSFSAILMVNFLEIIIIILISIIVIIARFYDCS